MSAYNKFIEDPVNLLFMNDKEFKDVFLRKKSPLNSNNYLNSMDHKISLNILKSAKYEYENTFKNNPHLKKLNFIKRLLTRFEHYKQNDVYSLTLSPFIEEPNHILEEIKEWLAVKMPMGIFTAKTPRK